MAVHLGTFTVISKSAWTLICERWKESKLQKARLILAIATFMFCALSLADIAVYPSIILGIISIQMVATFWPNIIGSLVRPILLRTTTLVPAEPRTEIVTEYHHDASWFFYEMTPELSAWYKQNCTGWMGVIPEREQQMRQSKRVFWFTNPDDAFQFRMRWSGV